MRLTPSPRRFLILVGLLMVASVALGYSIRHVRAQVTCYYPPLSGGRLWAPSATVTVIYAQSSNFSVGEKMGMTRAFLAWNGSKGAWGNNSTKWEGHQR